MKKTIISVIISVLYGIAVAQTPLTLDECLQLARKNNTTLKVARSNITAAEQKKKEAFTNYFPQISAVGTAFNANKNMIDVNTGDMLSGLPPDIATQLPPGIIPPSIGMCKNGVVGAVTATQPVFAGGQIVNGNKLAHLGVETSRIQLENSENKVDLMTQQYFWQVVSLTEKLKTLDAVNTMLMRLEKDVTVSVNAGVALRNDLLQVQLKVNDVASSRIKLENALSLSLRLLAQHVGIDGQDIMICADSVAISDIPVNLRQEHSSALLSTANYRLMQKGVEANSLQYKMAMGKNMPTVGIGASYAYQDIMGKGDHFGMVFVSVNIPISGWWGGTHSMKRHKINTEIAREQLDYNSELMIIGMDNAWNEVEDSHRQLQLAKQGIDQSGENLRLNNDYYRAGTATMNDLLEAQHQYQSTRDRFIDAYIEHQISILKYKQATGQL